MRFTTTSCLAVVVLIALAAGGLGFPPLPKEKADPDPPSPSPSRYVHIALYTFKATAPKGTTEDFVADAEKCFGQIPEVRRVRVGPPAKRGTPKAVNVEPRGDYHVGAVLTFDGFAGLAKWEKHPKHAELKKKYAKFLEKVVTYDFEP